MSDEATRYRLTELAPDVARQFAPGVALRVHSAFEQAQSRWRAAQTTCAAYGFQSVDWLACWHQHVGERQGWRVCLVELCDDDDRTLMLLPLGMRRERGLRLLSFLGGEVTDYNAPLIRADFAAALQPSAFSALWTVIIAVLGGVDVFRVRRMPQHVEGVVNPMVGLAGMRPTERAHAAVLTDSYGAFQRTRSANLFADTRRKQRRLAALGAVQLVIAAPAQQRAEVIDGMARQKARRWQESGSRNLFAEPGYLAFYQALAAHGLGGGEVIVSALYVDAHLVATHWGMRYGSRFYWLMPGYEDGVWARYSPGRIVLDGLVQYCIAQRLAYFDLTVGDEAYKAQWADQALPLYAGQQGYSWRGRMAVACDDAYRRLQARARANPRLRSLIRRWRGRHSAASNR